jgi:hypothetical protein
MRSNACLLFVGIALLISLCQVAYVVGYFIAADLRTEGKILESLRFGRQYELRPMVRCVNQSYLSSWDVFVGSC